MKGYYKTENGIFVNIDNANYIHISGSLEDFDKFCVYVLFGTRPGHMSEGIIVKDRLSSKEEAEEWIADNLLNKQSEQK